MHADYLKPGIFIIHKNRFNAGGIAADCSSEMDQWFFPYGISHASENKFSSKGFKINVLDRDVRKTEKVYLIMNNSKAIQSLVVCNRYNYRPKNCGECISCYQTKAMFLARCREIPPIFKNMSKKDLISHLDVRKPSKRAHLIDIWLTSQKYDTFHLLPGLDVAYKKIINDEHFNKNLNKNAPEVNSLGVLRKSLRKVFRY